MPTPLYDALKDYAERRPLRFHMPGHKGKFMPAPELMNLAGLDVTELPLTGNLYTSGPPFDQAQSLWAQIFGFDCCQFLTGGSTMGIHTGLALCARPGDRILMDRGCHRAAFHALALLDLQPVFLERPWLEREGLTGPISPDAVDQLLIRHPDIKTICITSPTYAGVLSNIEAISRIVHRRGGKLFVDGAHGAHLPFLGLAPFSGADAAVVSAHKTLPAMGQAALLFTNGIDPDRVRQMASVYGSSSPSYPMMASIDLARDYMSGEEGRHAYRRAACRVFALRQKFPSLGGRLALDPTRFTLKVKDGPSFARALEGQGIFPEMEDGGHVIFIATAQDSDEDFSRLEAVLEALRDRMGEGPKLPAPPLPERVISPRAALFASSRLQPLEDSQGAVAACQIAPYPPGVPVVAPGERIGKKELAYLKKIGYNMLSEVRVTV